MMEKKSLKQNSLDEFFTRLRAGGKQIYAPHARNQQVNFEPLTFIKDVTHEYIQTNQSPKFAVFPRVEELLSYRTGDNGQQIIDRDLDALPDVVLFGVRPCDAAAMSSLSAIFNWDYRDELFNARMDKTAIVGMSCRRADADCFCTSVGGHPGGTKGSDILLTELSDGDYLVEILTEKGEKLIAQAGELLSGAPTEAKEANLADVPVKFSSAELGKKLANGFDSPVWVEQSLRCIGCGACAFVCPTCACFDIQDEGTAAHGSRLRCWDSCGLSQFTLHASGHNPREVQSQRWRQRLMHKFSYMPERLSVLGCVGCGRCSRTCPTDMNILEHLQMIAEAV
jgi:sulfhydrogenase subunit beta (sulfur reductase)